MTGGARRFLMLLPVVAMALFLAACGGSSSSSDSSTAASTGSEEATTQNASAAGSKGLALAEERLAVAEKPQQELPLKTPLESAPESGLTIAVMSCNEPACTINSEAAEDAAKSVGVAVKNIPFEFANPATLVSGMKTALRYNPIATFVVGLPEAVWASVIPEYEAAGAAIIGEGTSPSVTIGKTVIASIPPTVDDVSYGKPIADWIAVDSGGKGKALYQEFTELPNYALFTQGMEKEFAEVCPECELSTTTATLTEATNGAANQALVSQLRTEPEIEYVVVGQGNFSDGLRSALDSAGLQNIKILGIASPDAEKFTGLENGTQSAWGDFSIRVAAFAAVDAALRFKEGMKIPSYAGVVGSQLVTQKNVKSISQERRDLGVPPIYDYAAAYEKLWQGE